ncbi:eCIS core domain-containing protein [Mycobacterium sp.]
MGEVRIHTDLAAHESASSVRAAADTVGRPYHPRPQ